MSDIVWPLDYNIIRNKHISNTFGKFRERTKGHHWGWDFYAPAGTACYAIADAISIQTYGKASSKENFGLVLVLEFEFEGRRLFAAYCHLSKIVTHGIGAHSQVKAGDLIAYSGNSGNAYNMKGQDEHLHFELRETVRPLPGEKGRLSPIRAFKTLPLKSPIIVSHQGQKTRVH